MGRDESGALVGVSAHTRNFKDLAVGYEVRKEAY